MINKLNVFKDNALFDGAAFSELTSYHWESAEPYRPKTFCKIGVAGDCLKAALKCYEASPVAVFEDRDDPIYKDSCLEFFAAPVDGRKEYINVECNSKGVFLTEFGEGREGRRLVSAITDLSPVVEPFFGEDDNGSYWGVEITLTKAFLSALYSVPENEIIFKCVKANFYKCGDECAVPHYLAFSPVTTLPPGFHNPECFATFKTEEVK